ncbi:MAG: zinc ribbon domain-containing protein [Ktedonobacteraceae bacterium]|nr:zinc ribbon domain-containing protein [Ktedonobacteraceae bacterium]MBV9713565.1 zinc ribbon domain-containing protein [Ktedonobacteraceae bacterium]
MYCSTCGQQLHDGAHFCEHCGASLELPAAVTTDSPTRSTHTYHEVKDPYKEQITQLRLELKQMKLDLKQIKMDMSNRRAQYNQTAAFVPGGTLRRGYKMLEDFQLWSPQRQKEALQQEILRLEQELLGLEQAQAQWKVTQQG